jgi:hypothetical protein
MFKFKKVSVHVDMMNGITTKISKTQSIIECKNSSKRFIGYNNHSNSF